VVLSLRVHCQVQETSSNRKELFNNNAAPKRQTEEKILTPTVSQDKEDTCDMKMTMSEPVLTQ
jgi:hypothetical protein